mgnify:CR=1 FL=1
MSMVRVRLYDYTNYFDSFLSEMTAGKISPDPQKPALEGVNRLDMNTDKVLTIEF